MNQNKTRVSDEDVNVFLEKVEDPQKREDSYTILKIMKDATNLPPKIWGGSMVGFDQYHYKYKTGREGDYFRIGFSPRKQNLTLYLMDAMASNETYKEDFKKLGKYTTGKSCLYIKRLSDINLPVLKKIIQKSYENMNDLVKNMDGWN